MPSPFPGMNPYLEQDTVWPSVHHLLISAIFEALVPQIRPRYVVKISQHVYIHAPEDERRLAGLPDVTISARQKSEPSAAPILLEAPAYATLEPALDIERIPYIEVLDGKDQHLVTAIEVLSPSNKRRHRDRESYLAKRAELLASPAHLVEIDLLRGGARLPLRDLPAGDYYVMVSLAEQRPQIGVWPILLRRRLPVVPIPLAGPDKPAEIDLQAVLHLAYDRGAFGDHIYHGSPDPALPPRDAAWAGELIPGSK